MVLVDVMVLVVVLLFDLVASKAFTSVTTSPGVSCFPTARRFALSFPKRPPAYRRYLASAMTMSTIHASHGDQLSLGIWVRLVQCLFALLPRMVAGWVLEDFK